MVAKLSMPVALISAQTASSPLLAVLLSAQVVLQAAIVSTISLQILVVAMRVAHCHSAFVVAS